MDNIIRLAEPLEIASGSTIRVQIYTNSDISGIINLADEMMKNGIICLDTLFYGQSYIYLHKLVNTISDNPYPRATTRKIIEEEYTTIKEGTELAYIGGNL